MRTKTTPRRGGPRPWAAVERLEARTVMSASATTPLLIGLGDVTAARVSEVAAGTGATLAPSESAGILRATGTSVALKRLSVALAALPGLGYVEPRRTLGVGATPDDPSYASNLQWGLNGTYGIDAPAAWDATTGSTKTTVAVIDTGVDYKHVDLYRNIWINQGEIPASRRANLTDVDGDGLITFYDLNYVAPGGSRPNQGAGKIVDVDGDGRITGADLIAPAAQGGWADGGDDDADGYVDDVIGWNFVTDTNNPLDDHGHGTHVSGIVAAQGNNGVGVSGVAWTVQVMALKFLDAGGDGYDSAAAAAIRYAAAHGAKVLNNSYGGAGPVGLPLSDAVAAAAAAGSVFVAAAGNASTNIDVSPFSPASSTSPNVVSVAALASNGALAGFSNYGATAVDLAAPGVDVYSTTRGGSYGYMSGTSMAAPFVSGAAALLFSAHPTWTYSQVVSQLLSTVTPLASLAGKTVTGGTLNVGAAVPFGASAAYQGSNATTKGDWTAAYGSGGYAVPGGASSIPAGLGFAVTGAASYTWASSTPDVRALQDPSGAGRAARAWYSSSSFTVSLDAGPTARQVSLYMLDWDRNARSQRVDVVDPATGAVLDSRAVSAFGDGVYLTWAVRGPVQFRFTRLAGANAVLSGVFLGGASSLPVDVDATTKGNWIGAYGAGGYAVAGGASTVPAGLGFAVAGAASYTWASSTADVRALQDPSGAGRAARAWYSSSSFTVSLDAGPTARQVSLYMLDWDRNARSQRVDVVDPATGAVLDSRAVSAFGDGVYLTWAVRGPVQFRFTRLAGANAVLSGVFINQQPATYTASDAVTKGDWAGAYGAGGYAIAGGASTVPADLGLAVAGASSYTWASSTSDVRALQDPPGAGRAARAWYSSSSFTVSLDAGPTARQVSLYMLDWDRNARSQRVDVVDPATGAVLDSRAVSAFGDGVYLTWAVRGPVQFRFTRLAGANAVLSGIFLD